MQRPKILLVMQNAPVDSGFLAQKFIRLMNEGDVHLLVWDNMDNIDEFVRRYQLNPDQKQRIHVGVYNWRSAMKNLFSLIYLLFLNSAFRSSLSKGNYKDALFYLPTFYIKPDIIHYEFGTLAKRLAFVKENIKAKLIVSFRGYDLNYVGLDKQDYYADVWRHADAFHFLGNDLKNRAVKRGYLVEKLEQFIPPAIDLSMFRPALKQPEDKFTIVSVGRLNWKKGFEYGIRAVAGLKNSNILFEYIIVGDGPHMQALQFTIAELGLEQNVVLLGKRSTKELVEILGKANVFLHPAISEGFCNAVIEAQAMGLPVIATDADGLSENIVNDETGFIVPKWDVHAMVEKLEWCYFNKEKCIEMGKNGVKRVEQHFEQESQIKAFVDFYQKVYEQ